MGRVIRVLGRKELEHKFLDGKNFFNSQSKVRIYILKQYKQGTDLELGVIESTIVDNGYLHSTLGSLKIGVHRLEPNKLLVYKVLDRTRAIYIYYLSHDGRLTYTPVSHGKFEKVCIVDQYLVVYLPDNKYRCISLTNFRDYGLFDGIEIKGTSLIFRSNDGTSKNFQLSSDKVEDITFTDIEEVITDK